MVKYQMDFLDISLILSTLFCSLVTGLIFTYAIVVMPGLAKLNDRDFIKAFQVTDGIIQNNQPLFMIIWIGSIISIILLILSSIVSFGFYGAWFVLLTAACYLVGVQGITITIHLPLNNKIQKLNVSKLNGLKLGEERIGFETKWKFYNNIRTAIGLAVSLILLIILALR